MLTQFLCQNSARKISSACIYLNHFNDSPAKADKKLGWAPVSLFLNSQKALAYVVPSVPGVVGFGAWPWQVRAAFGDPKTHTEIKLMHMCMWTFSWRRCLNSVSSWVLFDWEK